MRTPVADPPAAISPVRTWTSLTWISGTSVAWRASANPGTVSASWSDNRWATSSRSTLPTRQK